MKDFTEAAREHVIKTYKSTNKPDEYEIKLMIGRLKEHCQEDFKAGANHAEAEAQIIIKQKDEEISRWKSDFLILSKAFASSVKFSLSRTSFKERLAEEIKKAKP